eukprot:gene4912-8501_t
MELKDDNCTTKMKEIDLRSFELKKPITKKSSLYNFVEALFSPKKKPTIQNSELDINQINIPCIQIEKSEFEKLEDFIQLEELGRGAFSKVIKCQNRTTKKFYAMKILKKIVVYEKKQIERSMNEKLIQSEFLGCPFIVNLYKTFQDDVNLYMILEYVSGGELLSWLRVNKKFSDDVVKFIAAETLIGIEYLHTKGTIYRDLKPENILIDKSGHIKIADLGFVKKIGEQKTYSTLGTSEYLAPEIAIGSGHDKGVDYWSLGVLIYEMLVGKTPFSAKREIDTYNNIISGKIEFPKDIPKNARDLISKLLNTKKTLRLGNSEKGIKEIKEHPFFEGIDWSLVARRELNSPITVELDDPSSSKYFIPSNDRKTSIIGVRLSNSQNELFKDF